MVGLAHQMSWPQFLGWLAYAELEPFGEVRADLRAGTIAAVTAEIHRDRKKRSQPYQPRDFMPDFDGSLRGENATTEPRQLTEQEARERWERFKSSAISYARAKG